jgi:hypothetical protein
MEWTFRSVCAVGIGAVAVAFPVSGSADTVDQPFLVTTSVQFADSTTSSRDVLLVRADANSSTITGTSSDDAARLMRDRSCLAVVQRILEAGAARTPYPIGVALDATHIVSVPLTATLAQPGNGARLIEASGDTAGIVSDGQRRMEIDIHIDARVLAQDGKLQAATFRQLTSTPGQALNASECSLQRLPVAPAAPAAGSIG